MKTLGLIVLLAAVAGSALAGGGKPVPEIDPAAGVGALAMLSGAALIIRGRRKKQG